MYADGDGASTGLMTVMIDTLQPQKRLGHKARKKPGSVCSNVPTLLAS